MGKYVASKEFYGRVSSIAVPLALQSVLSSCMGIVDSLMVSWIGMVSAVGTAAQVESISNGVAFGIVSGVGIFCAQFFGAKDSKNLKRSFGLSLILTTFIGLLFLLVAGFFGPQILRFYLNDDKVISYGNTYLQIVKYSYLPSLLCFSFNYVYRAVHKAKMSLIISFVSMITNCIFNYLLIFGKLGLPKMGVGGAALATVMAQSLGLIIHVIYAYKTKQPFIGTFKEMFGFDIKFVRAVMRKVFPLIFNELLFGFGSTLFIKAFGSLGTKAMDAYYVGTKISEVFFFVIMGLSNANTVITGHTLGSGDINKAKKEGDYFIGIAGFLALIMSVVIVIFAKPMVMLFNLQEPIAFASAVTIVRIFSLKISLRLFIVLVFGALRAGGDSKVLTLLDSGLMWAIGIPLAFLCVKVFKIQSIGTVFIIIQVEQIVRLVLGMIRYKGYKWAVNLTNI
ncbi:putative efflux protein, MATE family [Hathewaya proteolytica DSM 3090]|uniref:Probable multidrug resistance protein NorM n=1 Tax=Hathewaya proteolytica DSM 3090 TaxID=1121331 RepID=A0A1M6J141_9CLOT|nr:MATE family efflux transporter [Hathewaya proteolytica]SHJ40454.1 putative efflux protein, MATE family [Hathewaya proteolytica DSM 3090]